MLASVSDDQTVRLWAPTLPDPPLPPPFPPGESFRDRGIPASPNGTPLASAGSDAAEESMGVRELGEDGARIEGTTMSSPQGGGDSDGNSSGSRGMGGGSHQRREGGAEASVEGPRGGGVLGRRYLSGKGKGWGMPRSKSLDHAAGEGGSADARGRGEPASENVQAQGREAWDGSGGNGDRYHDGGFSAKIAALRW